jgi:hypothetical protein
MIRTQLVLSSIVLSLVGSACSDVARPSYPDRRGGRGEPCLTLNDCKEPLVCGGNHCIDPHSSLTVTGKECVALECTDDSGCCPNLRTPAECDELEASCAGDGFCLDYQWAPVCVCDSRCRDFQCVRRSPEPCETARDCGADLACVDGRCTLCADDESCGEGSVCEAKRCIAACTADTDCAAIEACAESGHCETRPCYDDRECKFALGADDARCTDGACRIPCENDARCASVWNRGSGTDFSYQPPFVCSEGECAPAGCARDTDCAGLRGLGTPACVNAQRAAELGTRRFSP